MTAFLQEIFCSVISPSTSIKFSCRRIWKDKYLFESLHFTTRTKTLSLIKKETLQGKGDFWKLRELFNFTWWLSRAIICQSHNWFWLYLMGKPGELNHPLVSSLLDWIICPQWWASEPSTNKNFILNHSKNCYLFLVLLLRTPFG